MSVWYQYNVEAYGSKEAIAKFFNLNPEDINYIDSFSFSFGQKNAPGLRLQKIIDSHTDLVFMVKESIEQSGLVALARYNENLVVETSEFNQYIKINRQLLEEYKKHFPTLVEKHLRWENGFQGFRWEYFLNSHEKISKLLDNANNYRELICLPSTSFEDTLGFDNEPLE